MESLDVSHSIPDGLHSLSEAEKETVFNLYKTLVFEKDCLKESLIRLRDRKAEDRIGQKESESTGSLYRWEQQLKLRHSTAESLSRRLQIPIDRLAMYRDSEWRQRMEVLDCLNASLPVCDRSLGDDQWQMGLRNAKERWIAVKSPFGNIYTSLRDPTVCLQSRGTLRIHSHADRTLFRTEQNRSPRNTETSLQCPSLTERHRDWMHSEFLKTRCRAIGLTEDSTDFSHVCVTGHSVLNKLWEAVSNDIQWTDVQKALQIRHPALFEKLQSASSSDQMNENDFDPVTESGSTTIGPAVQFSHAELFFLSWLNDTVVKIVTVECIGTTAIFYQWITSDEVQLQQLKDRPEHHLGSTESSKFADRRAANGAFYLMDREGVLLPGEQKDFKFLFSSKASGFFRTTFKFITRPAIKNLSIVLQGFNFTPKIGTPHRKRIEMHLRSLSREQIVGGVIAHVLESAAIKLRSRRRNRIRSARELIFLRRNAMLKPTVYYKASSVEKLQKLYDRMQQYSKGVDNISSIPEKKPSDVTATPGTVDPDANDEWDLRLTSIQAKIDDMMRLKLEVYIQAQKEMNELVSTVQQAVDAQTVQHAVIIHCLLKFAQEAEEKLDDASQYPEQSLSERTAKILRAALADCFEDIEDQIEKSKKASADKNDPLFTGASASKDKCASCYST